MDLIKLERTVRFNAEPAQAVSSRWALQVQPAWLFLVGDLPPDNVARFERVGEREPFGDAMPSEKTLFIAEKHRFDQSRLRCASLVFFC